MIDNGWLHDAELVRLIIIIMAGCWLLASGNTKKMTQTATVDNGNNSSLPVVYCTVKTIVTVNRLVLRKTKRSV
jgi:hypothetical protein